jgi:hypothetical protein
MKTKTKELILRIEEENFTARHLITSIANDWIELSHDKIKLQRDDYIRWAKKWLETYPEGER